jgi:hypothetical protein
MIPWLALILVMLGAAALVAVAWEVHSRSGLPNLDRADSLAAHQLTSRDRPPCDACRYERELTKLASRSVQRDGASKRQEMRRIAPRQHVSPGPGRSRRESRLSYRPAAPST